GTSSLPALPPFPSTTLFRSGACPDGVVGTSFYEKALNAQEAGAAAAIIYNNAPGLVNPTVEGEVEITIPVIFVGLDDGLAIYATDRKSTRLNSSHVKISYAV